MSTVFPLSWVLYMSNPLLLYTCSLLTLTPTPWGWNYYCSHFIDDHGRWVIHSRTNCWDSNPSESYSTAPDLYIALTRGKLFPRMQLPAGNQEAKMQNIVWKSLIKSISVFRSKTIKSPGFHIPEWRRIRTTLDKEMWHYLIE